MGSIRTVALLAGVFVPALAVTLSGCDKKSEPTPPPAAGTGQKPADPVHKADDGHDYAHDHDHDDGDDHGHGPTIQLGEQLAGGFTIKASRDGDLTPGGDAPIDVWVTGGTGKIVAVRFWIGTQDAKGSAKAKAEIERDNWHTHVEVPTPLPAGSKLWVEVESDKGEKVVVGFELKV